MASFSTTSRIVVLFVILNSFLFRTCLAYTCFFPNGAIANSYVACSPNGDGSCCLESDFCTSLGYCVSQSKGYHYRGACTDSTWFNPSCPDYCIASKKFGNSSAVNLIACNAAQNGGSWCCAYNGNCCSSSTFVPSWGTLMAEGAAPATSSAVQTVTVSYTTSVYSTSTPSSTTDASLSDFSAIACPAPDNTALAKVGAGVGVPLGILAVAGLVLYYIERKKRIKAQKAIVPTYTETEPTNSQKTEAPFDPRELPDVYERRYELPSTGTHELGE